FERVGEDGLGPLLSLVERKLAANLQVSTESLWVAAIPIALALWAYLARYPTRPYQRLKGELTTLPAALAATLVAAVLGSALNDSGAIVGGVASMVLAASLVVLLMDLAPESHARREEDGAVGCDPVVITAEPPPDAHDASETDEEGAR